MVQLYLVNKDRKEYAYCGEAESNDITFVFTDFGWKINERIVLERYIDDLTDFTDIRE